MSKQYELMHLSLLQSIGSIVNLFSVYQKQIQITYIHFNGLTLLLIFVSHQVSNISAISLQEQMLVFDELMAMSVLY
jgi:hypothetical protein